MDAYMYSEDYSTMDAVTTIPPYLFVSLTLMMR